MNRKLWIALALSVASPAAAQQPRTVYGTVRLPGGEPVAGANVFVLETLDGAISDSVGAFVLAHDRARFGNAGDPADRAARAARPARHE